MLNCQKCGEEIDPSKVLTPKSRPLCTDRQACKQRVSESRWVVISPQYIPQEEADKVKMFFVPRTVCSKDIVEDLFTCWRAVAMRESGTLCETKVEQIASMWLDVGGMISLNRKLYTLQLEEGLRFTIAAEDVESYMDYIAQHERGEHKAEEIVRHDCRTLPSMHTGVLLTLRQFALLKTALQAVEQEAAAIASAEHVDFNEKMKSTPHLEVAPRKVGKRVDA